MTANQDIVNAARSFLGVKYKHQGRINLNDRSYKLSCCDCIGLIAAIIDKLYITDKRGILLSHYIPHNYPSIPDGIYLQKTLDHYLQKKTVNSLNIGNIVLIKFMKLPQHLAVIGDYTMNSDNTSQFSLIHSYLPMKSVVEHRLDQKWRNRIISAYSLR